MLYDIAITNGAVAGAASRPGLMGELLLLQQHPSPQHHNLNPSPAWRGRPRNSPSSGAPVPSERVQLPTQSTATLQPGQTGAALQPHVPICNTWSREPGPPHIWGECRVAHSPTHTPRCPLCTSLRLGLRGEGGAECAAASGQCLQVTTSGARRSTLGNF